MSQSSSGRAASPPEAYFYFTPIRTSDRKHWLEQTLLEGTVYFRSRNQLNDPNELRPAIVFEGPEKQLRLFVRQLILQRWPHKLSPANRLLTERELMNKYRHSRASVEETLHGILDRIGLFCLSESATEPLLWAHYADGHRGIALEFNSRSGLFLAAQSVVYSADAPVINRLVDSPQEILEKSMLTKGEMWRYEKEWRVIARWNDPGRIEQFIVQHAVAPDLEPFMRHQHGPGHYLLRSDALRSVVLGSQVSPDDEAWLHGVVARMAQPILIRRANLARNGVVTIA